MSNWRSTLLARFVPGIKPVIAVSDAHGIMREEGLLAGVEAKGFTVLFYDEPLAFRQDYEARFRQHWDAGETVDLVVAFNPGEHDFESLPFDVLSRAHRLNLTLQELFPKLSYDVVRQLDPTLYDALHRAQDDHATQQLGDKLTKEFVLLHLFEAVPALIGKDAQLLSFLCRLHYRRKVLPPVLLEHLASVLAQRFSAWPVRQLLGDRALFWAFLQERWPVFLQKTDGARDLTADEAAAEKFHVPGPRLLPFGHDDVRVFIDNLFTDGVLTPIAWDWNDAASDRWVRVGLLDPAALNPALRLSELLDNLRHAVPASDAPALEWKAFALRWAQLRQLWLKAEKTTRSELQVSFDQLHQAQSDAFAQWMQTTYPRQFNQPPASVAMVHHIPSYLARLLDRGEAKRVALLLIDGLAVEQWMALKAILQPQLPGILIEENVTFAWLPSITPISRQAVYSGKVPSGFPETVLETTHDEKRWGQFWAGRGLAKHQIAFKALPGDQDADAVVAEWISNDTKAVGVTLYKVDEIMHGMQLGSAGMINQVEQWAKTEVLALLLGRLFDQGFTVIITADHGNTEAVGIGIPQQGDLCDRRGERNRLFADAKFAEDCVQTVPGSRIAHHSALPADLIPVIAPPGKAFTAKGRTIVCHGGDSLEEMAVPFVLLRAHKKETV